MNKTLCGPRRNSFERFLHHFFEVLVVVQSTECFVLSVKPCVGFPSALSEVSKAEQTNNNQLYYQNKKLIITLQ